MDDLWFQKTFIGVLVLGMLLVFLALAHWLGDKIVPKFRVSDKIVIGFFGFIVIGTFISLCYLIGDFIWNH